jgi:hypothetical protein
MFIFPSFYTAKTVSSVVNVSEVHAPSITGTKHGHVTFNNLLKRIMLIQLLVFYTVYQDREQCCRDVSEVHTCSTHLQNQS